MTADAPSEHRVMPRKARPQPRKIKSRAAAARRRRNGNHQISTPQNSQQGYFERFACYVAHLAGRPAAFLLALATIIIWSLSGPLFGYSDTWQLVINTSTTIITFLMVFLIQNSQNRDTAALQVKLDALIFANRGTKNHLAAAESMSDEDLERLHDQYREQAAQTAQAIASRRPRPNGKRKAA
jgi:low affinity Fe/Cu permease